MASLITSVQVIFFAIILADAFRIGDSFGFLFGGSNEDASTTSTTIKPPSAKFRRRSRLDNGEEQETSQSERREERREQPEPFSCFGRDDDYYADVANQCQHFYVCDNYRQFRLSCPRGNFFQQTFRACVPADPVSIANSCTELSPPANRNQRHRVSESDSRTNNFRPPWQWAVQQNGPPPPFAHPGFQFNGPNGPPPGPAVPGLHPYHKQYFRRMRQLPHSGVHSSFRHTNGPSSLSRDRQLQFLRQQFINQQR